MKSIIYLLIFSTFLLFSCEKQKPDQQKEEEVKMEGELSYFTCSDSGLNQRFKKLSKTFDSLVVLDELSWLASLPYFRPAQPYLESAKGKEAINLMWSTYLQTGNKLLISDHSLWDTDLREVLPTSDSTNLYEALLNHEYFQRLTYLALSLKKEEIALQTMQSSSDIFQRQIKDKYDYDAHSFKQSLNEDLLALHMDLLPKEESKSIIRNVFEKLLNDGLVPESFGPSEHVLLPLLSKYDKLDLAYKLIDNLPDQVVATWMMRELAGIRPSLNAPGFRNPIIHPKVLKELDFVEGQLKTPYGLLFVRLDYSKPMRVQVKVPAKATLVLPVKNPAKASILANKTRLWMGGKPQPAPAGVQVLDVTNNGIIVELAKGKYTFQIKS